MTAELTKIIDTLENFTLMTEREFLKRERNSFDTSLTLIVHALTDRERVKEKVYDIFGERKITDGADWLTVPPVTLFEKTRFTYGDLIEIIFRLRDPDGCPWDRAQTLQTIRTNIIEEAYELTEAVELDDVSKMTEECGDVMLQAAFSAVMGEDGKRFSHRDVLTALCQKLIARHTHIFGKDKASDADEALLYWEQAKAKEKGQNDVSSKLQAVPKTFPALLKAYKIQKIIKKTGFDFPTLSEAVEKIYEEVGEFLRAEGKEKEREAGDILFAVVNVLRLCDIDPEVALFGTVSRFIRRFEYVITGAQQQGMRVEELTLAEMEAFYQAAKRLEK